MRTTYELLMGSSKEELIEATICLGMEPLREDAELAEWAQHLADGMDEYWENLLLALELDETKALMTALDQGLQVSRADAEGDEMLLFGLQKLGEYGLAEECGNVWEIDPRVAGWLQLSEADLAQQHMQDGLYDYMRGWILHVGMMPVAELTQRAVDLLEPETKEEREDLLQLCHALLIARDGVNGMFMDDYEELWHIHEDLEDVEALYARLRMPLLAKRPYPAFREDALVFSATQSMLAGDVKLYRPLLELLEGRGQGLADVLVTEAATMIQNEHVDETIGMLSEACGLTSLRDIEQLTDVVTDLSNAMPRWYNKGYSPDEMASTLPGRKAAMPGRNAPCPCGSGRKYKQCCGRRMN